MLIDWFTVGAQALNFLVLVWLLKRFLYTPVLAAIDAREKQIASRLDEAAARAAGAQQEREQFQQRNQALDRERGALLHKAADEAAAERQRLLEAARQDSQLLRARLAAGLASERAGLDRRLLSLTQAEVLALARGTLAQLAGVSLEDRMIEVFLAHLRALPRGRVPPGATPAAPRTAQDSAGDSAGDSSGDSARGAAPAALVRSAFPLAPAKRPLIEAAIHEHLGAGLTIAFETSPELVCGIELRLDGVKLAWSIADYLASIAAKVAALTASAILPAPAPALASAPTPASAPTAPAILPAPAASTASIASPASHDR